MHVLRLGAAQDSHGLAKRSSWRSWRACCSCSAAGSSLMRGAKWASMRTNACTTISYCFMCLLIAELAMVIESLQAGKISSSSRTPKWHLAPSSLLNKPTAMPAAAAGSQPGKLVFAPFCAAFGNSRHMQTWSAMCPCKRLHNLAIHYRARQQAASEPSLPGLQLTSRTSGCSLQAPANTTSEDLCMHAYFYC